MGIVAAFGLSYLLCFIYLDDKDNKTLVHYAVFVGGAGAFLLSFIDDLRPLGGKLKLLGQIGLGLMAYKCGLAITQFMIPFTDVMVQFGPFGIGITVFWFVAVMNLINLIDGLDGLAGGVGLMLMVLLAYLSYSAPGGIAVFSLILSVGMIGAILGFLFHNFPPAKVYMGDSGAYMIGYVIAALALMNSQKGAVAAALLAPVLALALPIVDVSFAMIRRGMRGLPLFRPDKQHIHHRLMRTGLSHRNTGLVLYGCSLIALLGGLLFFADQGRYLPIFLGFGFVVVLFILRGQNITAASLRAILDDSFQARHDTKNALYLKNWFVAEVERADTGNHLWADFHFVLKKMGFCKAELQRRTRGIFLPGSSTNESEHLDQVFKLRGAVEGELKLYADKQFSERQFAIMADIAAEAWVRVRSVAGIE